MSRFRKESEKQQVHEWLLQRLGRHLPSNIPKCSSSANWEYEGKWLEKAVGSCVVHNVTVVLSEAEHWGILIIGLLIFLTYLDDINVKIKVCFSFTQVLHLCSYRSFRSEYMKYTGHQVCSPLSYMCIVLKVGLISIHTEHKTWKSK